MRKLCEVSEIPEGKCKGFDLGDLKCFVVHYDGNFYLYENRCPHLGVELEWMPDHFLDSEGCLIHCSMHGALFTINDGHCISGPCLEEYLGKLPLKIEAGVLYLDD